TRSRVPRFWSRTRGRAPSRRDAGPARCASTPRTGGLSSTAAPAAETGTSPSSRRGEGRGDGLALVAAAALFWSLGGLLARLVATDAWATGFLASGFAGPVPLCA